MPLMECELDGKPGFKYGSSGTCYTYPKGDAGAKKRAKKRAIKQAIAIHGGKAPENLAAEELRDALGVSVLEWLDLAEDAPVEDIVSALAKAEAGGLPTEDLVRVDVLAAGGPYFGKGSPPEGDYFTKADLEAMAKAGRELAAEVKPPNKIGHGKEQRLLKNSGLVDDDEQPAAGWLDPKTYRVEKDGKDVWKLYVDVKGVPKKLARLIRAGSFRTRSVEISRVRAQTKRTGGKPKVYDAVITGLAWLGAKAPAVRTLDDVLAWFADGDEGGEPVSAAELLLADANAEPAAFVSDPAGVEVELRRFVDVELADGDTVWRPEEGLEWLRDQVRQALNPGPGSSDYWVRDVANGKALVASWKSGEKEAWVVPFEIEDGTIKLSPSSDWVEVKQTWVEADGSSLADALELAFADGVEAARPDLERVLGDRADTSGEMAGDPKKKETVELSDEQIVALAGAFGITEDDAAKRREAVLAKMEEALPERKAAEEPKPPTEPEPPTPTEPEPNGEPSATLSAADLEVLRAKAERGDRVFSERETEKRDSAIHAAVKEGRIEPAKREFWEEQFKEIGLERASALLAEMPVNEEFLRVYGGDDDVTDPETATRSEDEAYAAYMASQGYDAAELPTLAGRGS
jgi:hypothetical protein